MATAAGTPAEIDGHEEDLDVPSAPTSNPADRAPATRRRLWWRAGVAVVLASAAGVLVTVAGAVPARAHHCDIFEPWCTHPDPFPFPFPPPIIVPIFPVPAPPPPPIEPIISELARSDALHALTSRPQCNQLVSGSSPFDGRDAVNRLSTTRIDISPTPHGAYPDGLARADFATYAPITLYPPFFENLTYTGPEGLAPAFGNARFSPVPTTSQLRATVLLHEVGHLTGSHDDVLTGNAVAFNKAILRQCFGLAEVAPAPDRRPPGRGPIP